MTYPEWPLTDSFLNDTKSGYYHDFCCYNKFHRFINSSHTSLKMCFTAFAVVFVLSGSILLGFSCKILLSRFMSEFMFPTLSPSDDASHCAISVVSLSGSVSFLETKSLELSVRHLSLCVRKPTICLCENKDADQLRGNREADQRLCFRYTDSTVPLLLKSKISSL